VRPRWTWTATCISSCTRQPRWSSGCALADDTAPPPGGLLTLRFVPLAKYAVLHRQHGRAARGRSYSSE
jgi:hypothetical protein